MYHKYIALFLFIMTYLFENANIHIISKIICTSSFIQDISFLHEEIVTTMWLSMRKIPGKEVADGLRDFYLGHGELGGGSLAAVVFPHHELAHVARGELSADATGPQHITQTACNLKEPVGEGKEHLMIAARMGLKAVELLEAHILAREEVFLATASLCNSMDNGHSGILHMYETFASFGTHHHGLAVARQKEGARTGLGVVGANHKAGTKDDDVPVGMLCGSLLEEGLALLLAEGIE